MKKKFQYKYTHKFHLLGLRKSDQNWRFDEKVHKIVIGNQQQRKNGRNIVMRAKSRGGTKTTTAVETLIIVLNCFCVGGE
jgi:hypothetical protein